MDVCLEHVRDAHALVGREFERAVDVAMQVHHERDALVVRQIAAIAQCRSRRSEPSLLGYLCFHRTGRRVVTVVPAHIPPSVSDFTFARFAGRISVDAR